MSFPSFSSIPSCCIIMNASGLTHANADPQSIYYLRKQQLRHRSVDDPDSL